MFATLLHVLQYEIYVSLKKHVFHNERKNSEMLKTTYAQNSIAMLSSDNKFWFFI